MSMTKGCKKLNERELEIKMPAVACKVEDIFYVGLKFIQVSFLEVYSQSLPSPI